MGPSRAGAFESLEPNLDAEAESEVESSLGTFRRGEADPSFFALIVSGKAENALDVTGNVRRL